jgi:hypothetical protein
MNYPPGVSITYAIPKVSGQAVIADINDKTVSIKQAGSFKISAVTNKTDIYEESAPIYASIQVKKFKPTIVFDNDIFPNITDLLVGKTYSFKPATITLPSNIYENIPITYTCDPSGVVTITGTNAFINRAASFRIVANTSESTNFLKATAQSSMERTAQLNSPNITFTNKFINQFTYGFINSNNPINTYILEEAIFTYPENKPSDINIEYSIPETTIANIIKITPTIRYNWWVPIYGSPYYKITILKAILNYMIIGMHITLLYLLA